MSGLALNQWASRLSHIAKAFPKGHFVPFATKEATAVLHSVVERSPVGDPSLWKGPAPAGYVPGTFKNNWFVELGSVTGQPRLQPDASGSASLQQASNLEGLRSNPFTTIYIYNPLPYANRLEHGWSTQAPMGIVALTVTSLRSRVL